MEIYCKKCKKNVKIGYNDDDTDMPKCLNCGLMINSMYGEGGAGSPSISADALDATGITISTNNKRSKAEADHLNRMTQKIERHAVLMKKEDPSGVYRMMDDDELVNQFLNYYTRPPSYVSSQFTKHESLFVGIPTHVLQDAKCLYPVLTTFKKEADGDTENELVLLQTVRMSVNKHNVPTWFVDKKVMESEMAVKLKSHDGRDPLTRIIVKWTEANFKKLLLKQQQQHNQ